jgi:hypothetical protein
MRSMKKKRAAYFVFLLRGLAGAAIAMAGPSLFALDSASAWKGAVAMDAAAKTVYPGAISFQTIEYGKKDEIVAREELSSRIAYGADGATDSELVRAVKDGKDVTAERKAEFEKNAKRGKSKKNDAGQQAGAFSLPEPFNPPAAAKTVIGQAAREIEGGKEYWDFPFEYALKGAFPCAGTIRLDAATGRPVSMAYEFKSPPLGIKYAHFLVIYAPFGDSAFIAERMDIDFDAQILLIHKKMDMKIAMSDYQERGRVYGD